MLQTLVNININSFHLWRCNVVDKNIGVSWTQPKAPVKTINIKERGPPKKILQIMALITIFHFKNTLKRYIRQIFTYIGAILPQRRQGSCWQEEFVRFCCCFRWPWLVVEMVMIVKTMVKMILLMERLMMKMSNAWIWGGGCQGEN